MADYWVEIDYEARFTIAYKIEGADSPRAAEDAALEAVGYAEDLPVIEQRINVNGGWNVNRRETRPLTGADEALLEARTGDELPTAA